MKRTAGRIKTRQVDDWLQTKGRPEVLHVFDSSCSLRREGGGLISIVNPAIGAGPFNLVLAERIHFPSGMRAGSTVEIDRDGLTCGGWIFDTRGAKLWDPRPEWHKLSRISIDQAIPVLERAVQNIHPQPALQSRPVPDLQNPASAHAFARSLAGLGPGLTPSGDDFLMGLMHALWARRPPAEAARICGVIAAAAVPITTSLSGAWLQAAKSGDVGELWKTLFSGISAENKPGLRETAQKILMVGHTSGADAMDGFISGLKNLGAE